MIHYNSKKEADGFYTESTRNRIFLNGNLEKLVKFRRVATMRGGMIEYFYGNIKYIPSSCSEEYFYRMSGSNLSLCLYLHNGVKRILAYKHARKIAYRYLRRFYPEELL